MALTKLKRIEREIEKTRGKITEYQNKIQWCSCSFLRYLHP